MAKQNIFDNDEFFKGYKSLRDKEVNTLADAGFKIVKMAEPYPTEELVDKYPEYYDLYHRPDFLFVKAVKQS